MFNLSKLFNKSPEVQNKDDAKQALKVKYQSFQSLLSTNNEILEIMADMEEKLSGEYLFDMHYLKTNTHIISDKVFHLIEHLNVLSKDKYPQFLKIHEHINKEIEQILEYKPEIPVSDLTIPVPSENYRTVSNHFPARACA